MSSNIVNKEMTNNPCISCPNLSKQFAGGHVWPILAILFLVVVIALAITSIALGNVVYHTKKGVNSMSTSKPRENEG